MLGGCLAKLLRVAEWVFNIVTWLHNTLLKKKIYVPDVVISNVKMSLEFLSSRFASHQASFLTKKSWPQKKWKTIWLHNSVHSSQTFQQIWSVWKVISDFKFDCRIVCLVVGKQTHMALKFGRIFLVVYKLHQNCAKAIHSDIQHKLLYCLWWRFVSGSFRPFSLYNPTACKLVREAKQRHKLWILKWQCFNADPYLLY